MDARTRTTGLILALGVFVLVVLATIATRLTADSGRPNAATDALDGHAVTPGTTVAPRRPGSDPLTEAGALAVSPRAVGTTPAVASPDADGDATIGTRHECDADDENGSGAGGTPRSAGAIRGVLVSESGPWTAGSLPKHNMVMIELVAVAAPHASRFGVLEPRPDAHGNIELTFAFEDVLEGEYDLALSALGNWRWAPLSLRVRPPLDGVTFTRYDKDPALKLRFEVIDAELGSRLESIQARRIRITPSIDAGVFLHTGPFETDDVPLDARFTWSVWADGFAPAFGDETAFVRGDDARIAHIELERGWSTEILALVRDPEARQARGAEVLVDGRRAGFTDGNGLLVVRAPARPATLEVRLSGWKSRANPLEPYAGKSAAERGHVTIVMLERE